MGRFVVGRVQDLPRGASRSVRAGQRRVALFNQGGELFAVDEACPHMRADLSNGRVEKGILICAWHGWKFDLQSGAGLTRDWACLKTHRLTREGAHLVLEIADTEETRFEITGSETPGQDPTG